MLQNFNWESMLEELEKRAPDVLDFLATIAVPKPKDNNEKKVPALCAAYGVLMNSRWKELSLVQKINSIILGVGNATAKVLLILICPNILQ